MMDAGSLKLHGAGQHHLDGQGNLKSDIALIPYLNGPNYPSNYVGAGAIEHIPSFRLIVESELMQVWWALNKYFHT